MFHHQRFILPFLFPLLRIEVRQLKVLGSFGINTKTYTGSFDGAPMRHMAFPRKSSNVHLVSFVSYLIYNSAPKSFNRLLLRSSAFWRNRGSRVSQVGSRSSLLKARFLLRRMGDGPRTSGRIETLQGKMPCSESRGRSGEFPVWTYSVGSVIEWVR